MNRFEVGDEVTITREHLPEEAAADGIGTVLKVTRHEPPAQANVTTVRYDVKLVGGDRVTIPEPGLTY